MSHPTTIADMEIHVSDEPIDLIASLATRPTAVVSREKVTLPAGAEATLRFRVKLPAWSQAVYHAPFQRHAINPALDLWPEGLNQCQPLPVPTLQHAKRGGLFLLLRLEGGDYLAVLPLTGHEAMASLRGDAEGLVLEVSHFGSQPLTGDFPLLAYARAASLYQAARAVWATALDHPLMAGVGAMRLVKPVAPDFEYLGWCSFEEYKLAIDENNMCTALRLLAASPAPVRWALIDDGHIDDGCAATVETQEGAVYSEENDPSKRRVQRAGTHPQRFPRGWSPLMDEIRGTKIRSLGLWLNFNGYWGGIAPRGDWPFYVRQQLTELDGDTALPVPEDGGAEIFWSHLLEPAIVAGMKFLKVDNQAGNLKLYAGRVPNAVAASVANKQALERLVARSFGGQLINCMAHNGVAAFHTPVSAVTRCSEDYKCGDAWRAKHHLHNSFGNMLWLGATVWGDHDMFHSSDPVAAGAMARSKALSCGPVYLSDHPEQFRMEHIRPLCFHDGRLLRPLAPAMPLPESAFLDPYEAGCAYRVGAPLPHGCAAVGCFNLAHPDRRVAGAITAGDHALVRSMIEVGPVTIEAVVITEWTTGRAWKLEGAHAFALPVGGDELFILSPVQHGWALIGATEKFLAPSFVSEFTVADDACRITVPEPGRVCVWSRRRVVSRELAVRAKGSDIWEITFPAGCLEAEIHHAEEV